MSENDFDAWVRDMGIRFPPIGAWLRNLGPDAGHLMLAWSEALEDVDLADALEVNRRMLCGDDPGPGEFATNWQGLPAHVRLLAKAARLRSYVEGEGRSEPNLNEPRYKCGQCQDRAVVFVATRAAQKEVLTTGSLVNCRHRVAVVICNKCDKGRMRQQAETDQANSSRRREKTAVMSEWFYIVGHDGLYSPEQIEAFAEWCQERKAAWFDRNRVAEFDRYNREAS